MRSASGSALALRSWNQRVATFSSRSRRVGVSSKAISWIRSSRSSGSPLARASSARRATASSASQCAGTAGRLGRRRERTVSALGARSLPAGRGCRVRRPRRRAAARARSRHAFARVVGVHQRGDAEDSEYSPAQEHGHRSGSRSAACSRIGFDAARRWWRAPWSWRDPTAAPLRSVNLPPASSTMTVKRRDVEDVHVRLDDHVERAARQQVVVHEIAVAADAVDAADQTAEARPGR